ncbi:MAG TPA: pantoate--beta-alanine ligase [Candidatus Omnitrophota bacterium]|nr:pantoate--beta-alanine ligase [Candidatus Omnitrophota bacterium]
MILIRSAKQFQITLEKARRSGKSIGFVPTMGALHEGHLSLVRKSKNQNNLTAVSIFVNPTQFGPDEDFKKYPRVLKQDVALLKKAGVDYLFYPSVEEVYPKGTVCSVAIDSVKTPYLIHSLCGRYRPGHFEGVATVVAKLFNLSGACNAYFGEKDWQQTRVIKRLIEDFKFPVSLKVLPTLREKDGLAMSSRNRYLSFSDRRKAGLFARALRIAARKAAEKEPLVRIQKTALWDLKHLGLRPQYFEFVDGQTLEPLKKNRRGMRLIAACFAGETRLIDNVIIRAPKT